MILQETDQAEEGFGGSTFPGVRQNQNSSLSVVHQQTRSLSVTVSD